MSLKNLSAKIKIPKTLNSKLLDKRIKKIYDKFEKSLTLDESFAVAVSGGPDSLALAFLARIYSLKKRLTVKYFIVDHKLRLESTKEAQFIKKLLKKNSISSEILTWKGKKPKNNIQSKARENRYALLFKNCDKSNIKNIMIGHHKDDLIENFFIRMLRGSGLKGLVSLDTKTFNGKKILLRPLLYQEKKDLTYISKKVFNFFVKDPSNNDEKFQRIRVRKLIKEFKKDGMDKSKIFQTIKNLKFSNDVVDFYVKQNLDKNASFIKNDKKLILNKQFFQQPYEIIFRALSESIKLIGNKYYYPRGRKLDKIIKDNEKNRLSKVTLGGCIIEKINQTVIIYREN